MCHRQGAVRGALRPASQGHPTLTARNGPPPIRGVATVLPTGRRRVRPTIPPVRSPKTRLDSAGARRRRSVGWSCRNPAPRFALTARGGMMGRTLRDRPDHLAIMGAGGRGPRTMEEVGMARSVLSSSRNRGRGERLPSPCRWSRRPPVRRPPGRSRWTATTSPGVVAGPNGPEAGVWVIRRDARSAHPPRQDRRDGRCGTLPPPRSAAGHLRRVGARLRAGRLREGAGAAGRGPRSHGGRRPRRSGGGRVLTRRRTGSPCSRVPGPDEFPGTGAAGNGISPDIESQGEWIRSVVNTDGCTGCHALGNKATREIPDALGDFDSHLAAWDRRVQSGQAGAAMDARLAVVGRDRARWRCTPTGPTASRPASTR